jgi:hypothetical protein
MKQMGRGATLFIGAELYTQPSNMPTINPAAVRRVILFSGHMIDAADRARPRFPPRAVAAATEAIERVMAELHVGPGDLGLTEGASGGDLIFAETLLARGAALQLRLPFHEAEFRRKSVAYPKKKPPADRWLARFIAVRSHGAVTVHALPDEPALLLRGKDAYERTNLWMLRDVLAFGAHRAHFVCLWDGARGDGPGGTAHMMRCMRQAGGKTRWLDTRRLWKV